MKISKLRKQVPVFMVISALGLSASPAFSQGKGKAKVKANQTIETKGKHGREAGELPFGLEQHKDKTGELPSGLQKKHAEDGSLTRGLEEGGKGLKSTGKANKGQKK
jgi:hypothetical protein